MKYILTLLCLTVLAGCPSTGGQPDPYDPGILAADFRDVSTMAEALGELELAADALVVAACLDDLDAAIDAYQAGAEGDSPQDVAFAALEAVEFLANRYDEPKVVVYVTAARILLRRFVPQTPKEES